MPTPLLNRIISLGRSAAYLLADRFTVDRAAPISSPRPAEPGPGIMTVLDTTNLLTISAGELVYSGGRSVTTGDPGVVYDILARRPGRATFGRVYTPDTAGTGGAVLCLTTSGAGNSVNRIGFYIGASNSIWATQATSGAIVDTGFVLTAATYYDIAIVERTTGYWVFYKLTTDVLWTLLWVGSSGTSSTLGAGSYSITKAFRLSRVRTVDLGGALAQQYGIATNVLTSPAAGAQFTHEANCYGPDFTVTTRPSAGSVDIIFRRQDASNYWIARVNSAGDFSLQEVVAGSATQRANTAAIVSSGHRCVIVCDGTTIRGYSGLPAAPTLRWTYASAANFATATNGEVNVLGTAGVLAECVTWPLRTTAIPRGA